jgi:hypothetical protein
MSNAHTFSILFWVYSSRTSGDKKPIYARVTVNGRRANFSLKLKVDPLLWDSNRHRAKGNSQSARILNGYLDQAYAKLVHCYQMLRLKDELLTALLIKATYLGEHETQRTLQEIIHY